MSSFAAFLVFLVISILLMLLLVKVVRKQSYAKRLSLTNDVAGFYITVIGTLYSVLIGFIVLVVWTRFDQAEVLVENEATALANIHELVGQLPNPERGEVRGGLDRYAHLVVTKEWEVMYAGKGKSTQALNTLLETWTLLGKFKPVNLREQVILNEAFDQMSELYKARRLRLLANEKQIPAVLWLVLVVGGILTVGSTAFFGVEQFGFHALKISFLTTLICLLLYSIWEIDQPFRHYIRVSSDPFVHSKEVLNSSF